jgi:hypothetical protein
VNWCLSSFLHRLRLLYLVLEIEKGPIHPPSWSIDPFSSGILKRGDNVKRGRGRPRLTWDETVKRDLKEWNIAKELAMDRSAWRLAINVPEP